MDVIEITIIRIANDPTSEVTIGFLPHVSGSGFAPMFEGNVLVKAPSLRGHALVGGLIPSFTEANERTALKASRKLNSGAWAPVAGVLTKTGKWSSKANEKAEAAQEGLLAARSTRQSELNAARTERNEAAKAAKAAKKAAQPAKATKAKTGKGKTKTSGKAPSVTPEMAVLADLARIRGLLAEGVPASFIATAYKVDEAAIAALAPVEATGTDG